MRCARPVIAIDPRVFGRRRVADARPLLSGDDVRLFLTTFTAGFAFVAVLIAWYVFMNYQQWQYYRDHGTPGD